MFDMTNTDAIAAIIRYANVLGLRVVDAPKGSFLPRGVRVICRSWLGEPLAYLWSDGRVSAGANVHGSFSADYANGTPTVVVDPAKVTEYFDAVAAASLDRYPNAVERRTIARRANGEFLSARA